MFNCLFCFMFTCVIYTFLVFSHRFYNSVGDSINHYIFESISEFNSNFSGLYTFFRNQPVLTGHDFEYHLTSNMEFNRRRGFTVSVYTPYAQTKWQKGARRDTAFTGVNCDCDPIDVSTAGKTGVNCDIDIDECSSNPCVKGVCSNGINRFDCICPDGIMGEFCEKDVDECRSNPCKFGVCQHAVMGVPGLEYACNCDLGYKGVNCDHDEDYCSSSPCHPEYTHFCETKLLSPGNFGFLCHCNPGADGLTCGNVQSGFSNKM